MIAVVDYGLGNVCAFANIYRRLGIPVKLARSAADLSDASHLILPGVGAFDWAMKRLDDSGMRGALDEMVLHQRRPVLGVCVGMQMMGESSEEGEAAGLGWVAAKVRRFNEVHLQSMTHLPHMGWNDVEAVRTENLFAELGNGPRFYFLHSYYVDSQDGDKVLAWSVYGERFACAIQRGNILGVQFHPEKSHSWGVQLLKNFAGCEG
jgi:glutamine amidotransferase